MEAERELVSGSNIEYSGVNFSLLFLAEYATILFFRIYRRFIFNKWFLLWFFFVYVYSRCVLPRIRYDTVIKMCWKYMFGVVCVYVFVVVFYMKNNIYLFTCRMWV
jgi:NADH:ubiquinone oxidoreductase subunit H